MKRWILVGATVVVVGSAVVAGSLLIKPAVQEDLKEELTENNLRIEAKNYYYAAFDSYEPFRYSFTVKAKDGLITLAFGQVTSQDLKNMTREDIVAAMTTRSEIVAEGEEKTFTGQAEPGRYAVFLINWDSEKPVHADFKLHTQ